MKLSDYVTKFLVEKGIKDVFMISGGGIMHLCDSVGNQEGLNYYCNHHEQAATMGAEAYARMKGFGVGIVTVGPGVVNSINGLAGAFIDSTPIMMISGQVNTYEMVMGTPLRQFGLQEVDSMPVVESLCKYSVVVMDPNEIRYHLEKAYYLANHGRKGPVWVDLPLDVQTAQIDENNLKPFIPENEKDIFRELSSGDELKELVKQTIYLIRNSKRPVIYGGNGIRLSNSEEEFKRLIDKIKAPTVLSWNGADLIGEEHPQNLGRPGMFGQRYSNFAVQNSDVLLLIGARMSIPQTGYNYQAFARDSKIILVEIDKVELEKKNIKPHLSINADAKLFLEEMNKQLEAERLEWDGWLMKCQEWKRKYPIVQDKFKHGTEYVNSYVLLETLSEELKNEDVIVTDMGESFTCSFQSFKVKEGQRFFTSSGLASMGFGLPGAIGACIANDKKRTICLGGDGGLLFNIQELQTIRNYNLPIKIFVFNNHGYNAITSMQAKNFKSRFIASDPSGGVTLPDYVEVGRGFKIPGFYIKNHFELKEGIKKALEMDGPVIVDINMDLHEMLEPRVVASLKEDGGWSVDPLEDMTPHLDRDEFKDNMFIDLWEN